MSDDKVLPFPSRDDVTPPDVETPLMVLLAALQSAKPLAAEEWLRAELETFRPRLIAAVRRVIEQRDVHWKLALEQADPVLAKKVVLHLPGRPS